MQDKDIGTNVEEYFKRTMRLSPLVLADKDILNRIMSAANHQYGGEKLDESILMLGEGTSNRVYSIGCVIDPANQRKIPVAIRLMKNSILFFYNDSARHELQEELRELETAYALGENVPYFMSVATFLPFGETDPRLMACGIITEDLSDRLTLPLREIDKSRFERTNADGQKEVFFVDPNKFVGLQSYGTQAMQIAARYCSGSKYLADNARINLNLLPL